MKNNQQNPSSSASYEAMSQQIAALKTLYKSVTEYAQLAMLLAANCGLSRDGMVVLRQCNVDWNAKRLYRRGGFEISDQGNSSLPSFPLWPETLALLGVVRSQDRTEELRPVLKYGLSKNTQFSVPQPEYEPLFPWHFKLPLEAFRVKAAKVLWEVERYREIVPVYLGKDSWKDDMKDISPKNQAVLDDAVTYLRDLIRLHESAEIIMSRGRIDDEPTVDTRPFSGFELDFLE